MAITLLPQEAEVWAGEVTWSRSRSMCIRVKMGMWEFLGWGFPAASPPARPRPDPAFQSSRNFLTIQ